MTDTPLATIDTVHGDAIHLFDLLDVACDLMQEMPFEREGERDEQLDKINSLIWIARDMAEKLKSDANELPRRYKDLSE